MSNEGIRGSSKHIELWNKERNGEIPETGLYNQTEMYWWKCACGYEWQAYCKSITLRKTNKCIHCLGISLPDDLLNKKFGKWEVIERTKNKEGKGAWLCRCECGSEIVIRGAALKAGRTKGCNRCHIKDTTKFETPIAGQFWRRIERGAKVRDIEFNITPEYAYDLFLKQNKKCALTGADLMIYSGSNQYEKLIHETDNHASLDRIDSNKGYIIDNIQWVRKDINMFKGAFDQDKFIEMCQWISDYQKEIDKQG